MHGHGKELIFIFIFFTSLITGCQYKKHSERIQFAEIRRPYKTLSPYISNLQNLNGIILKAEVKKFWSQAEQNGLPLIEEDSLETDYKYVTLIYQDSTENKEISFEIFGTYDEQRFGDMRLRKLGSTDLYYRCYKVPNDICFSYRFIIKDTVTGKEYKAIDKFNSNRIPFGKIQNFSYSVFDLREKEPDFNAKKHNNLNSQIDTIKYKDKIVNKDRDIYVYLPPSYDKNRKKPYPVLYLFDAFIYLNRVQVPNILDNLITDGQIEPIIAVLFETYKDTRGITLPLNFKFRNEFVSDFLPMIQKNYNSSLKPESNIIGGISYGGLAAAFIALHYPDIFGKILSQSGSFWRGLKFTDMQGKWIREDWLINKFITEEKKDLKIYLDWGLQENWVLDSNRRMVRELDKKGYDYKFIEFNGWHDWSNSRKTFPQGLIYLLSR